MTKLSMPNLNHPNGSFKWQTDPTLTQLPRGQSSLLWRHRAVWRS